MVLNNTRHTTCVSQRAMIFVLFIIIFFHERTIRVYWITWQQIVNIYRVFTLRVWSQN